ncbi:MAG: alpha/beta hydrolase family protein [Chloroflexota bacterium]
MTESKRFTYGSHTEQVADLTVPSGIGPFPVMIALHGGGFAAGPTLDRLRPICADLTGAGLATWNVEYRRLEGTGGGWPETWQDAAVATDFLQTIAEEHRLDLDSVLAFGHSAGAPLALWLASRNRAAMQDELGGAPSVLVRGAISAAGVCDFERDWPERLQAVFRELLGGAPDQQSERYAAVSPARLLPLGAPQLLIHGTADSTVPVRFSEEYVAAAQSSGDAARLVTIAGAEHSDVRDVTSPHWPAVRQAILEFANETLSSRLVTA